MNRHVPDIGFCELRYCTCIFCPNHCLDCGRIPPQTSHQSQHQFHSCSTSFTDPHQSKRNQLFSVTIGASLKMVSANGDGACKPQSSNANGDVLDYSTAREVLEKDYARRDGLSAEDLLDSTRHGGLAYNDFLVLPGYIGTPTMRANGIQRLRLLRLTIWHRLSGVGCKFGHTSYSAYQLEDTSYFLSNGHRHRAFHGGSHGIAWWLGCRPSQLLGR